MSSKDRDLTSLRQELDNSQNLNISVNNFLLLNFVIIILVWNLFIKLEHRID